jgi:uncharacterized membrane protein YidH (DUF202 family)
MKRKNDPFEIDKMEKRAAEKKKEMARIEREEARRLLEAEKKDSNLEKYRVVLERLQINWIKWNVTCIALGFTAYKFYYARVEKGEEPLANVNGWHIGIFLITLGFLTLVFATWQHKENVTRLKSQFEGMQYSLSLRISYVIIMFSFLILLFVIFKG